MWDFLEKLALSKMGESQQIDLGHNGHNWKTNESDYIFAKLQMN